MTPLAERIRERARAEPISLYEFVETALYDPHDGYYTVGKGLGKEGDFYTSPHLGSLFGYVVADYVARAGTPLAVLEVGAGKGYLCADVLDRWRLNGLTGSYTILERSAGLRASQRELLADERVTWIEGVGEIEGFEGVVVANELLDAFPFHRVVRREDGWRETHVCVKGDALALCERRTTLGPAALPNALVGQTYDVSPEAYAFVEELLSRVAAGRALFVDYGDSTSGLLVRFPNGSAICHKRHTVNFDLLAEPGTQDITHFINTDLLAAAGRRRSFETARLVPQEKFLVEEGLLDVVKGMQSGGTERMKRVLEAKSLLLDFPNYLVWEGVKERR